MRSTRSHLFVSSLCIAVVAIVLAGCGSGGGGASTSRATIVVSSSAGVTSRTPIPTSDIESLVLTVTRIEFQRCDGSGVDDGIWNVDVNSDHFDPNTVTIRPGGTIQWVWTVDGEHTVTGGLIPDPDLVDYPFNGTGSMKGDFVEFAFDVANGEMLPYFSNNEIDIAVPMTGNIVFDDSAEDVGDGGGGGHVTVFTGNTPIDVVDTTDPSALSELLNSVTLPSGSYCKIRLYVQEPVLTLVDGSPFITDPPATVKLTANGRLFIGAHFELAPGGESIIEISFDGLHLVESGGSGQLVLTPQMRADVVGTASIDQCVSFVSVDCESGILVVETLGGMVPLEVMLTDSTVITNDALAELFCDPDLLELDPGTLLKLTGTLSAGAMVEADTVVIDPLECQPEV